MLVNMKVVLVFFTLVCIVLGGLGDKRSASVANLPNQTPVKRINTGPAPPLAKPAPRKPAVKSKLRHEITLTCNGEGVPFIAYRFSEPLGPPYGVVSSESNTDANGKIVIMHEADMTLRKFTLRVIYSASNTAYGLTTAPITVHDPNDVSPHIETITESWHEKRSRKTVVELSNTGRGMCYIYKFLMSAVRFTVQTLHLQPQGTRVDFPTAKSSYKDGVIQMKEDNARYYLRVVHEYGHVVMKTAQGAAVVGGEYQMCSDIPNHQLAFNEGYATAFAAISLRAQSATASLEFKGMNIELYECGMRTIVNEEGRIAAFIYDLYDNNGDDNGGVQDKGRDMPNYKDDTNDANAIPAIDLLVKYITPLPPDVHEYYMRVKAGTNAPVAQIDKTYQFNYGN